MCHASSNPAPVKPLSPEEFEAVKAHPTPQDIPALIATIELLQDTSLARGRAVFRFRKALLAVQAVARDGIIYGDGTETCPMRTPVIWDDENCL